MARVKRNRHQGPKRVVGYVRVSTSDQAESGAGLSAQKTAIMAECERQGWELLEIVEDAGYSAKTLDRPGLKTALDTLSNGNAEVLMAAKLDRLSRSTIDLCQLGDMADYYGFDLRLLDIGLDTTTPQGRIQRTMFAAMAQYEREMIAQRTKEALAAKRAAGVRLGRPVTMDKDAERMILQLRSEGLSLRAIADRLNTTGMDTAQGGKVWYASTVKGVLERAA